MLKTIVAAAAFLAAAGAAQAATVNVAVYDNFTDTGAGITVSGAPSATGSFDVTTQEFVYDWKAAGTVGGYNQNNVFAAVFTGGFTTPTAGSYDFGMDTDDAGYLFIDGALALSLPGAHGQYWNSATLNLGAGEHTFKIEYDNVYCCDAVTALAIHQGAEFTTSPVPEPATWALMGLGFAGLGFAGYRNVRRERLVSSL
jgi:hypothetical protein